MITNLSNNVVILAANITPPVLKKALFLDRDGIINRELGDYVTHPDQFILNPGIAKAIKYANDSGCLVIVITNQGGIAKGLYTEEILEQIHEKMKQLLQIEGAKIDAIYYCPHHPDIFGQCLCRKPGSLLIEKAIKHYNINSAESIMIGDRDRDLEAAANCGIKGVLIEDNDTFNLLELLQTNGFL